jgi:hypothetical protein
MRTIIIALVLSITGSAMADSKPLNIKSRKRTEIYAETFEVTCRCDGPTKAICVSTVTGGPSKGNVDRFTVDGSAMCGVQSK